MAQAAKEKADKAEEEKKGEEVEKKVKEEKKVVEDVKVTVDLDNEDKAQGEKLVPKMVKEAAEIQKAKDSGDAVDNAKADVQVTIGQEKALKLVEPSDAPAKAASAANPDGDWVPPELMGEMGLAQTAESNTVVNGMRIGDIKIPELDQ